MKKNIRRTSLRALGVLAAALGLSIPNIAQAGISCGGPVNIILFNPSGDLLLDWGYNYVTICSLKQNVTYGGRTYTPEDCQLVHATAMTAMGSGNDINFYFPGGWTSCSQLFTLYGFPADDWNGMYLVSTP